MPGRHHTETTSGESRPTPFRTLIFVAITVLAVIAGVAGIAAWLAPTTEKDTDLSTILVQPSASMPYPTAATEAPILEELSSATPPTASPAVSGSPAAAAVATASAVILVESAPPPTSTTAESPAGTTSSTVLVAPSPVSTTPTTAPSLPTELTATYAVTSTSADGFVVEVAVHNPTATAQAWTGFQTTVDGSDVTLTACTINDNSCTGY